MSVVASPLAATVPVLPPSQVPAPVTAMPFAYLPGTVANAATASPPPYGAMARYASPPRSPSGTVPLPTQPQRLTSGIPDPNAIATQKAAYHQNIEQEVTKAEEMLVKQQKEQTDSIYRAAEMQKQQILNQIDQQAKEQEMQLSQKYAQQRTGLQQQCMRQKMMLENQASELSNAWHVRKMQEDMMEKEYKMQRERHDETVKHHGDYWREHNAQLKHRPAKWQYSPHLRVPIDVREEPDILGRRTEHALQPGECFLVNEELEINGVLYLRLADGRGWLFDKKPEAGLMCIRCDVPMALPAGASGAGMPPMVAPPMPMLGPGPHAMPPHAAGALPGTVSPPIPMYGPPRAAFEASPGTLPPGVVSMWLYSPEITAPMDLRTVPEVNGQRGPYVLQPGDLFSVAEERRGADGILYLRLADGRGWAFEHKPGSGSMCIRQSAPPGVPAMASAPRVPAAAPCVGVQPPPATSYWMYNPEVFAPIDTRALPEVESQRLSHRLQPGEVFAVSEETEIQGVLFLKLADGRGWLFDRKPGVGVMCVRHPQPAQPVACASPRADVLSRTAGGSVIIPANSTRLPAATHIAGRSASPMRAASPVRIMPGQPAPAPTRVMSAVPPVVVPASTVGTATPGGSVSLQAGGASVSIMPPVSVQAFPPTQCLGPVPGTMTASPAVTAGRESRLGSVSIPATQYVGPAGQI